MNRHNASLFLFTVAATFGAFSCKETRKSPAAAGSTTASALSAPKPVESVPGAAESAPPVQGRVGFDSTKIPQKCDKTAPIAGAPAGKIGAGCPKTWAIALEQANAWCADPAKSAGKPKLGLYENCAQYTIVVQATEDGTDVCYYDAKDEKLAGSRLTNKNGVTCRGDVPDIPILCPSRLECGKE
jgi:hypothetical protein